MSDLLANRLRIIAACDVFACVGDREAVLMAASELDRAAATHAAIRAKESLVERLQRENLNLHAVCAAIRALPRYAHETIEMMHDPEPEADGQWVKWSDLARLLGDPAQEQTMTWQPIETAPKRHMQHDLLGCDEDGIVEIMSWNAMWECWQIAHQDFHPTHWMPRPDPPTGLLGDPEGPQLTEKAKS